MLTAGRSRAAALGRTSADANDSRSQMPFVTTAASKTRDAESAGEQRDMHDASPTSKTHTRPQSPMHTHERAAITGSKLLMQHHAERSR